MNNLLNWFILKTALCEKDIMQNYTCWRHNSTGTNKEQRTSGLNINIWDFEPRTKLLRIYNRQRTWLIVNVLEARKSLLNALKRAWNKSFECAGGVWQRGIILIKQCYHKPIFLLQLHPHQQKEFHNAQSNQMNNNTWGAQQRNMYWQRRESWFESNEGHCFQKDCL